MKLKINESFASSYNARRKKEELAKLKMKYGDVAMDETDDEEESSSSDSDIDEDNILTDTRELSVINALMTNDPRIKDPNFSWFSDSDNEVKVETSAAQSSNGGKSKKQVYLRDIERFRLLDGKDKKKAIVDDESDDSSDEPMVEDKGDLSAIKMAFLGAASATGGSGNASLFTLKSSATNDSISSSDITVNKNKNKDELLLEYVKKISANVNDAKTNFRFMSDSESDNHENEASSDESSSDGSGDEIFVPRSAQTEVRSHPRRVPDSMRVATEGKKRSEKTRDARERKRREKEDRKALLDRELQRTVERELLELRRLRKEAAEERLGKIRRTAGRDELDIEASDLEADWDPAQHERLEKALFGKDFDAGEEETKPEFSPDEELDEDIVDWDDWRPGASGDAGEAAMSPGEGDEAEDSSQALEIGRGGGSRRRRRRRRLAGFRRALDRAASRRKPDADAGRFNKEDFPEGFDDFLDKVYALDCEDIILGRGEGQEDVKCRFKYRSVEPMDFGLAADEVLSAPAKELNSWVSLKKVTQIRSKDEEERDRRLFQSARRQKQKSRLLPTVFVPLGQDEAGTGDSATAGKAAKKKRKRKKKKAAEGPSEEAAVQIEAKEENDAADGDGGQKKSKKPNRKKEEEEAEECPSEEAAMKTEAKEERDTAEEEDDAAEGDGEQKKSKKRKRKKKKVTERPSEESAVKMEAKEEGRRKPSKKRKRSEGGGMDRVSDARIKKLIRNSK